MRRAAGPLRRPVARINRPLAGPKAAAARAPRPRIGLLGGSFNPAHAGHRAISLCALKRLRLHRVWWLVAPQNPLKSPLDMAGYAARLASAEALAAGHPRLAVSDLEARIGTRYSVDTIGWLRRHLRADLVWLIGADNLAQLPQWRGWRRLLDLVPIAVFDRDPYSYRALAGRAARAFATRRQAPRAAARLLRSRLPAWALFRGRRHAMSSTAIRRARSDGVSDAHKEGLSS
jgi:nicotinate-nucleotide adenylyltransferase